MNVTTRMQPNVDVLSAYFNYAAAMLGKVAEKFGRSAPGTDRSLAASHKLVSNRG
jgi:hypothetical protein